MVLKPGNKTIQVIIPDILHRNFKTEAANQGLSFTQIMPKLIGLYLEGKIIIDDGAGTTTQTEHFHMTEGVDAGE